MNRYEQLRYLILAAQREGNRLLTHALRDLDLTPSQAEVLRVLADHEPLTLRGLGELLVCETGSPSRLTATLVDRGLVQRTPDPGDARAGLLTLTPDGHRAVTGVMTIEHAFYGQLADQLDDDAVDAVNATLDRLVTDRPAGTALQRRIARARPSPSA